MDPRSPFPNLKDIRTVAGCAAAYSRDNRIAAAAVVVLSLPDLAVVEQVSMVREVEWPSGYRAGLLSFREAPPVLAAFEKLQAAPDVLLVDGQGIAHPRGFGPAAHLGLLLDLPTIGCAKTRLYGDGEEPVRLKGAYTFLKDTAGQIIGAALRTTKEGKPQFVSTGHQMTLDIAMDVVLASCGADRVPKPLRLADQAARAVLRAA